MAFKLYIEKDLTKWKIREGHALSAWKKKKSAEKHPEN